MTEKTIEIVDLFCGVGGLTCGLRKAGLNVIAGIDNDPTCEDTYTYNNKTKFICADISEYSSEKLATLYTPKSIKILVGCAPCQTFSKQTYKYKNRIHDKKWTLLNYFSNHIEKIQPDIISMENVPELIKFDIFEEFRNNLKKNGYFVSFKIVDCHEYGLPQKRHRLVLLASKLGEINLIDPNKKRKKKTVADVIGHLPPLGSGEVNNKDPLHKCSKLSEINVKRIRQSKPGGTWRDWDESLLVECHRKKTGKSYASVYGRMKWDEPSPTITTQFFIYGTGRFGHPEQDRPISLREGALLQTFPKNYKFSPKLESPAFTQTARHIGNAVPVELGKIIGDSIKKHLNNVTK